MPYMLIDNSCSQKSLQYSYDKPPKKQTNITAFNVFKVQSEFANQVRFE